LEFRWLVPHGFIPERLLYKSERLLFERRYYDNNQILFFDLCSPLQVCGLFWVTPEGKLMVARIAAFVLALCALISTGAAQEMKKHHQTVVAESGYWDWDNKTQTYKPRLASTDKIEPDGPDHILHTQSGITTRRAISPDPDYFNCHSVFEKKKMVVAVPEMKVPEEEKKKAPLFYHPVIITEGTWWTLDVKTKSYTPNVYTEETLRLDDCNHIIHGDIRREIGINPAISTTVPAVMDYETSDPMGPITIHVLATRVGFKDANELHAVCLALEARDKAMQNGGDAPAVTWPAYRYKNGKYLPWHDMEAVHYPAIKNGKEVKE